MSNRGSMTVEEARKAGLLPRSGPASPVPTPRAAQPSKVSPRASVASVGRTARGVMNKLEARYCSEVLDVRKSLGEVAAYWYESVKLRLAEGAWFTVDFFVMLPDGRLEAHEVKGHWREASRARIKVAAELYPFRFVSARKLKKSEGGSWKFEEFG